MELSSKWYTAKIDQKRRLEESIKSKEYCISFLQSDLANLSDSQSQDAIAAKKACIKTLQEEVKSEKETIANLRSYYEVSEMPILLFSEYSKNRHGDVVTCSYYWYIADLNIVAQTSSTDRGFIKGALDLRPVLMTYDFCKISITDDMESYRHLLSKGKVKATTVNALKYNLAEILSQKRVKSWQDVRKRLAKMYNLPKDYPLYKDDDYTDYAIE